MLFIISPSLSPLNPGFAQGLVLCISSSYSTLSTKLIASKSTASSMTSARYLTSVCHQPWPPLWAWEQWTILPIGLHLTSHIAQLRGSSHSLCPTPDSWTNLVFFHSLLFSDSLHHHPLSSPTAESFLWQALPAHASCSKSYQLYLSNLSQNIPILSTFPTAILSQTGA